MIGYVVIFGVLPLLLLLVVVDARHQAAVEQDSRERHYAEIAERPEPPAPAAEVVPFHLRHARGRRG